MDEVKVIVTDRNGEQRDFDGDVAYGCIIKKEDMGDGITGMNCESYLVSGEGFSIGNIIEPLMAGICLAIEHYTNGNPELENACLDYAVQFIARRRNEFMQNGGMQDAGNQY